MAFDEDLAARIRERPARLKGVEERRMFGGVAFLLDGNLLVGVWKDSLIARLGPETELILALNATVEGQTTAHYLADRAAQTGARISRLAQGVPLGGELDYLDEGTLTAALNPSYEVV